MQVVRTGACASCRRPRGPVANKPSTAYKPRSISVCCTCTNTMPWMLLWEPPESRLGCMHLRKSAPWQLVPVPCPPKSLIPFQVRRTDTFVENFSLTCLSRTIHVSNAYGEERLGREGVSCGILLRQTAGCQSQQLGCPVKKGPLHASYMDVLVDRRANIVEVRARLQSVLTGAHKGLGCLASRAACWLRMASTARGGISSAARPCGVTACQCVQESWKDKVRR